MTSIMALEWGSSILDSFLSVSENVLGKVSE